MERKARVGAVTRFQWLAPEPLQPGTTPTLTFRHPSGTEYTPALTPIRAAAAVNSIATDRRTLTTADLTAAYQGLQDEAGEAYLISPTDGAFPVRVTRVDKGESGFTVAVLAEPLPRPISTEDGASLQWRLWTAELSGALVAAAQRNVPYTVTYTARYGADLPTVPGREEGLLHVVRQPFSTGLTHSTLLERRPDLHTSIPGRQSGFAPQIRAAEMELIDHLRVQLAEQGLYEDDLDGRRLARAHMLLTEALLTRASDAAASLRNQAFAALKDALRAIWADANRDGVVDPGEADRQVTGARASSVGGSFGSTVRRFRIGGHH